MQNLQGDFESNFIDFPILLLEILVSLFIKQMSFGQLNQVESDRARQKIQISWQPEGGQNHTKFSAFFGVPGPQR